MVHSGARSPLDVGTVVAGTYTVEGLIGRGGMGAVFVASHARLPGKKVAIKVLHADVADAESLARFRREAEIASRLGHANIVEVHDFNVLPDGTPYLVLELLQGESLAQRLARGPLPLDQTLTIVRQVGSALAAAHREDIIHRDLKPQNVFLVSVEVDGAHTERAKVLDFGISKIRGSQTIKTQDTSILGTPQYMAPEQALGHHAAVDARTDVFALGAMVYEMLCGAPAFQGASVPEVVFKVVYENPAPLDQRVPGLPPHVVAAVHRALAKKADERFPDVASFVEALTGQPFQSGKRPLAIPAAESADARKDSSKEAFAQTVGSGDHGVAPVSGHEATVASGPHTPPLATTRRPSRAPMYLAFGAIAAAVAVAVVLMVTRGEPATVAVAAPDAAPATAADAAPAPVAALDAAPAAAPVADAAPAPDARTRKPPPKTRPDAAPPAEQTPDEPDEPEPAGMAECRGLLRADPAEARRCANQILEKNPRAVEAYVIRVKSYCDENDQEKAIAAFRKLGGRPRLRKNAAAYCAKRGIVLQ